MTLVHFNYTDSYNKPSRGSLAFTPHRRHAANETEILPKPVTVPLLKGEVTVNLQPNPSTWVWIITEYFEQQSESFYTTVPDSDGVIEAVDLVRINPSTIPAPYDAVEPAWWAEMRQYKQTVTDTLLHSEEAITEAKEAIEVGSESIEQTQHNASLAKSYSETSRQAAYDARDYRNESEHWYHEAKAEADRVANGPENSAQRAEDAADRAETAEAQSRSYEDEARSHAAEARLSETNAAASSESALLSSQNATAEANHAETEADRAQTISDDLLSEPVTFVQQAEQFRDEAQQYRDTTQQYRDSAEQYSTNAQTSAIESQSAADDAQEYANMLLDGEWQLLPLENGWEDAGAAQRLQYLVTPYGVHIIGNVSAAGATDNLVAQLPANARPSNSYHDVVYHDLDKPIYMSITRSGWISIENHQNTEGRVQMGTIFLGRNTQ